MASSAVLTGDPKITIPSDVKKPAEILQEIQPGAQGGTHPALDPLEVDITAFVGGMPDSGLPQPLETPPPSTPSEPTDKNDVADSDIPGLLQSKPDDKAVAEPTIEDEVAATLESITDPLAKARADKGLNNLVRKMQAAETELRGEIQKATQFVAWAERFNSDDASVREAAYRDLGMRLGLAPAAQPVAQPQTPTTLRYSGEEGILGADERLDDDSKLGFQTRSEDILYHRAVDTAVKTVLGELQPLLEPIFSTYQQTATMTRAKAAASSALPGLQAKYGSWVTQDMVEVAVSKFSDLPVESAFGATYVDEIARKFAEFGKNSDRKRPAVAMPQGGVSAAPVTVAPGEIPSASDFLRASLQQME
jgi:hypothetical protein